MPTYNVSLTMNKRDDKRGISLFAKLRLGQTTKIMNELYEREYMLRKVVLTDAQYKAFQEAKDNGLVPVGFDLKPEETIPQPLDLTDQGIANVEIEYDDDGRPFTTEAQFIEPFVLAMEEDEQDN